MSGKLFQKLKNSGYLSIEKHPFAVWFGSAVLMELVLEILSRKSILDAVVFVLDSPVIFMVNVLLILAPYSLMFLTKRAYFVHGVVTCILLLAGAADFILLMFRTTPLTAQDLHQINSALRIMEHYVSWFAVVLGVIAAAALLVGAVIWWRKAPVYQGKLPLKRNILMTAASFGAAAFLFSGIIKTTMLPARFSNIGKAYEDYGLVYCFVSSMVNTGIDKPDDYSEKEVEDILDEDVVPTKQEEAVEVPEGALQETKEAAAQADKPLGRQPGAANVIFLQLESFYDLTHLTSVELSEDPIPYMHSLEETYSTGFLSVPCVGAGTANTEFEIMTGMNLDFFGPGEYPYQTVLKNMTCESLAYIFHDLGYVSHAIHNNSAYFYDRHTVFSQLGYDNFTSIEYMQDLTYTETDWAEDRVLTSCIMDTLRDTEQKDYIYTISVQGHGSYPEEAVIEDPVITAVVRDENGEISEGMSNAYTYYANQIYEMDAFVNDLIRELEAFDEPVVLVMYGDHLPSLNIREEDMTEGNLFQTNYVIWSNFEMERQVRDVEAYQLGALVMSDINISDGILFRYHQKYLEEQPEDDTEYLDKMAMIGYDMLYGEQSAYGGENPYQPTRMTMGIDPVIITGVLYDEKTETMTVTGKNFTEFSIAIVNGKQYEPVSWTPSELVVENVPAKGEADVCVAQMDDYSKTILSTTIYFKTWFGSE